MPMTTDEIRGYLLHSAADRLMEQRRRPTVTIYDKNWENPMPLLGEIEASFEEMLNDSGEGSIKLFGRNKLNDWLLDELAIEEDVHIRVNMARKEWTGKCSAIIDEGTDSGAEYLTLNFTHEYEHIKKIVCYCNPFFPAEFQYPKLWAYAGPSAFGVRTLAFLNLLRRFAPLWALPEDLFNPQNWVNNLNPANWPIVVLPGKGLLFDTSMWSVISTRFGMLHDVVAPTLSDAKVKIVVKRWFPGMPQPAPEHFTLTQTTLTIDVVDKSGYVGPTGTLIDGLLHFVQAVASDLINEVNTVIPRPNAPEYSEPGYRGTTRPWVAWRNAHRTGLSGISSWSRSVHKATAGVVVTGGHSPDWVNTGLKLLVNGILGYIGAIFGNPGLTLGLFDSQIEDVVLAFHRVGNPFRINQMGIRGPAYGEVFESSGGTGFSLSALQAIRAGFWRTRAYTSYKFTVVNGSPYWVGRHFDVGDRVSAEIGRSKKLYVDQVFSLKHSWSRTQDPRWTVSIGDDRADDAPGAILGRQIEQVRGIIQSVGVSS